MALVVDCKDILAEIPQACLQHMFKEVNICVDRLVVMAYSLFYDYFHFNACPLGILLYFNADMM